MNKIEYLKPAIEIKRLRICSYLMAGSGTPSATIPGVTWAKQSDSFVYDEDEDIND
jgi:hypothetical protein